MRPLPIVAALASLCACGRHPLRPLRVDPPPPPVVTGLRPAPVVEPTPQPAAIVEDATTVPAIHPPVRDFAGILDRTNASLVDAYFDYDRAEVTAAGLDALRRDAAILLPLLKEFPELEIVVEGHCDERGSAAYNIALGARRAERASAVLETFGIPRAHLQPISYGNERPQCETPAESCWRLNRRAHLSARVMRSSTASARSSRSAPTPQPAPPGGAFPAP